MQKLIDAFNSCPFWAKLGLIIFSPIVIPIFIFGWMVVSMFEFAENLKYN